MIRPGDVKGRSVEPLLCRNVMHERSVRVAATLAMLIMGKIKRQDITALVVEKNNNQNAIN